MLELLLELLVELEELQVSHSPQLVVLLVEL